MKKLIRISIVLSLILSNFAFANDDDAEFHHFIKAFKYWMKVNPLMETESATLKEFSPYYKLAAISLHKLFKDPTSNFKLYRIANYNLSSGAEIPPVYQNIQTDKDGTSERVLTEGYYFFYSGEKETGARLIASPQSFYEHFQADNVYMQRDKVVYYFAKKDLKEAERFNSLERSYVIEKNPYRNAVVEFVSEDRHPLMKKYRLCFMRNVGELRISWDDLILDKALLDLTRSQTEGFLGAFDKFAKAGKRPKKGLLLSGPPGTGKSLTAQILISSINHGELKDKATFMAVSSRHLAFKPAIKMLFEEAGKLSPTVMFIEDIDLMGMRNREGGDQTDSNSKDEILNEFLNGMDGVKESKGLLVIGTTNRVSGVDPALLRSERLGMHLYYGVPKYNERMQFFERFGKKNAEWAPGVNSADLANDSDGMSGADIVELIGLAREYAFEDSSFAAGGQKLFLKKVHFDRAFKMMPKNPVESSDKKFLENLTLLKAG